MYLQGPDWHNVKCTRVEILYCYTDNSPGYTIRANGTTKSNLTLDNCDIHDNKAIAGAGLGWNCAGDGTNSVCIIKGSTKIHDNVATSYGGGIVGETNLDIQSALIYNNTAPEGGGMYLKQWGGDAGAVNGAGFSVTLGSNVKIYDNTATGTGGGIYYHLLNSDATGFNTSSNPIAASFSLEINGAEIYGNSANKGAGIAMYDPLAKRHYNSAINKWSGIISRSVTITSGSIHDNISTGDSGKYGAGIYIQKYESSNAAYVTDYSGSTSGGGTLTFTASGGSIYNNGVSNGTVNAGYGGGIFITHDFTTTSYNSVCEVKIQGTTSIYANQCTGNGGAIWLKNADFSMTGGTIGGSEANANKAGSNGGGFFITGDYSKVTVSGGSITYNTATNNGGGFYVAQTGTDGTSITGSAKVTNNKAKNGGGAFINDGTLTVNGSNVEIKSNEATAGNGGGIFANGGTVTLTAGTLSNNVATGSGTTGLGGGIYSKGALTIKGATIGGTATSAKNTAYDGAGVYVAGGTVSHTSGSVRYNEASHHGGGIYSTAGTVTINGANALIADNQATYQGGGIWAGGTVQLTKGKIQGNKTTNASSGKGGGVYVNSGGSVTVGQTTIGDSGAANTSLDGGGIYAAGPVTLNTGAVIQCNTASNDGGGVYVSDATFTMTAGTIGGSSATYGNKATDGSTGGGNGGGVYITGSNAKVVISGGTISYNAAPSTANDKGCGGGIYVASTGNDGTAISGGATVSNNTAKQNGGGIYVVDGKVSLVGASGAITSVSDNTATNNNGGGVYLGGGEFILGNYSTIVSNHANNGNGGGAYVGGTSPIYRQNGNTSTEVKQNTANNGAGIFMGGGKCYISVGYIHDNDATSNGGGIYVSGGEVEHSGGEIGKESANPNTAVNGAGLYMEGGKYTSTGGYFNGNTASGKGGGIYMDGGKCYFQGGKLGYNTNNMRNTAAYGGGLYMASSAKASPEFYMTSSDSYIRGNHATNDGGGIYMEGGTCSITAGNIGVSGYPNDAVNGGGIYSEGGTITVSGGNVNNNTATTSGGGIYAKGTVTFSNGTINNNTATSANGGGVYIDSTGELDVSGTATMTGNSVPSGMGGGVYQGGVMFANSNSLSITGNTKGRAANNVYLPHNKTVKVGPNITTTVDLGVYTERTVEGTVAQGGNDGHNIPVLSADQANVGKLNDIFNAMLTGTSHIVDDRNIHKPSYVQGDQILYFGVAFFDYYYSSDFQNPIHNAREFYQYMCWVNGVNGFSPHYGYTGELAADIDLSHIQYWTPIGVDDHPFTGTFDGNGYAITGLNIPPSLLLNNVGLFGTTQGATIQDTYVNACNYTKSTQGSLGCIVGDMQGGSIVNSTCSGTLTSTNASCVTGGMVGKLDQYNSTEGSIQSGYAGTTISGHQMGGLVGDLAAGCSIYNSHANTSFSPQSGSTAFMGGLVGVNKGRVENCYPIVRGTVPSGKFGYLAGDNTSTSNMGFYYCYAINNTYVSSSGTQGILSGVSTFTATSTPYGYKHHDNQVTAVSGNSFISNGNLDRNGLKGLLTTLNNWVNQDAAHSSAYLPWMRTSASPINSDYPIHNYSNLVCVASPDNVGLEYSADFNKKFAELLAGNNNAGVGTIYLYNSPTAAVADTLSNNSKATELYIHEDVVMLHSSAIKAHVGITIDNSAGSNGANPSFGGEDAIDWHFFSSAVEHAPIGLVYGDQSQYNQYVYPSWYAYFNNANGYFPTNLNDVSGASYYDHWDLYGYCEPDYHWINYKRNSASHWHEDWPDIHITYTNDTEFVPGRGYMVALKDEGYLQAYGTLNTDAGGNSNDYTTVPVTCTSGIGWTTREGHNLLGNPYQSYLDFWEFARDAQNQSLWRQGRDPFYIIMDEDNKDYVLYTVGQSPNPLQASRFLHPHQGFMIDVDVNGTGTARFSNAMRTTSTTVTTSGNSVTWSGDFRGGEEDYSPCYPLVNLLATDVNGNRDIVTVELGRPDTGGALKQDAMRTGKGSLWCHYNDEDYALVFTQPGLDYANIRFSCDEDAEFTMTWSTHNGEFSYLHLIDNMTGADIDCLQQTEYTFNARTSDYVSRFRLVFDYTGIEENEDGASTGYGSFAYYVNGEIHLTDAQADASLQIIDMLGRVVVSRDAVHTISTSGMTPGVYILRLTTANGTRTQKIILN